MPIIFTFMLGSFPAGAALYCTEAQDHGIDQEKVCRMSADGSTTFVWGGDERTFRLGIGELLALQERRNSGPQEILNRFRLGTWRIEDIQEILRLGLIGAMTMPGTDAAAIGRKAKYLVDANVRAGNITDNAAPARKKSGGGGHSGGGNNRLSAAALYGAGAVMHFTPQQVDAMSLYQFAACVDGLNDVNGGGPKTEPPTNDEFDAMLERHGVTLQ